jgi:hypothetical protein
MFARKISIRLKRAVSPHWNDFKISAPIIIASLIGYLVAFAVELENEDFANKALDELILTENEHSKIKALPVTTKDLLSEQLDRLNQA